MRSRSEILGMMKNRVLVIDGSFGVEVQRRSRTPFRTPEELNRIEPGTVRSIHRDYVSAGADVLLTNTFGGTAHKMSLSGISDPVPYIKEGARLAREAAGDGALVFGDIGPTGILPYPLGEGNFEMFYSEFKAQASVLLGERVDGILLETFSDILELKAAVRAVRDLSEDVFLGVSMTFDQGGRTLTGTDPINYALTFNDLSVDAIGMNCSLGPAEMLPLFSELAAICPKPIFIEPNAGLPQLEDGNMTYPVGPEEFSHYAQEFARFGARMVGGCCGTGPEHIREVSRAVKGMAPVKRDPHPRAVLTSPASVVDLDQFTIIGERINPAGRKKLREAMEKGDLALVMDEARAQVQAGAHVLDVNFGHEASVDWSFMEKVILSICYNLGTPVSLDIQSTEILEAMLRIYPGRPLVNSSTCKEEDLMPRLGMLKKHGGVLVVLSMGKDVPHDVNGRIVNVRKALRKAGSQGIGKDRLIFDPIVLSLGAGYDPQATLDTIGKLKELKLRTCCGLSNLSIGLPNRGMLNASFLAMAVKRGLTSVIMNPLDETLRGILDSSLMLDLRKATPKGGGSEQGIVKCLLDGDAPGALKLIEDTAAAKGPLLVLEEILKPAMERIGILYSERKIYLPQLIQAAQTSKPCFDRLESLMPGSANAKEKFVIATVKGDIHDIGKNIVAAIVRSSGYEVIDLGRDVDTEKIVSAVKEHAPLALGLSAMMTTTAPGISEVVKALKANGLKVPIIAGGASLNSDLVLKLGADRYAKDAVDAVTFLKERSRG
jgi:5-methyltetrahydrofolate--homocysteine methyltransferase